MIEHDISTWRTGKVAFCGDWHANRAFALAQIDRLDQEGVRTIVQVGDFGFDFKTNFLNDINELLSERNMILFFVDGNHENFHVLFTYPISEKTGTRHLRERVIHLPRGHRWEWDGISFLALGGAHSIDKFNRRPGHTWWPEESLSFQEVDRACAGGHADVMITHDCPTGVEIPGLTKTSGYGWPESMVRASEAHRDTLRIVCDEVKPHRLIHGHYHVRYENVLKGADYTTVISGLDMDGGDLWQSNRMLSDI